MDGLYFYLVSFHLTEFLQNAIVMLNPPSVTCDTEHDAYQVVNMRRNNSTHSQKFLP